MCALLFWLVVLSVRGSAAVETVNITLRVTTIIKPPFVMYDNATGEWSGYSIDLLDEIRKQHHFHYIISEVSDKEYGHSDENGKWTGMVARLIDERADTALGGLSFSVERARAIDFTIPIYDLVGISVVMKKPRPQRSLLTFLTVLETKVWTLVVGSYLCTSLLIHLFDKYSPYSHRNSVDKTRQFDFKESLWFCVSSLTSLGEAPRNLFRQLVAATWWLFGFIIVATYTANAAVSMLPRLQRAVASLDDLSRQYAISYAAVCDSQEYRYFRRMAGIEEKLHRIWMDMSMDDDLSPLERAKLAVWAFPLSSKYIDIFSAMTRGGNQCPESFQEGVDRVRRSQQYKVEDTSSEEFALIAEGSDVKYLTMTDCDLVQLGEEFSKKPYAIGLQKNSPWKKIFDDAIYKLQDDNKLEKLKRKWWNENPNRKYCADEDDDEPNYGMDIRDIGGVFIAVLAGIVVAYVILIYEYYRYIECRQFSEAPLTARLPRNSRRSFEPRRRAIWIWSSRF